MYHVKMGIPHGRIGCAQNYLEIIIGAIQRWAHSAGELSVPRRRIEVQKGACLGGESFDEAASIECVITSRG